MAERVKWPCPGQGLMTQPVQPKAGKITSCILRIFSSQLTVKDGTLDRWVFCLCDNSVAFSPINLMK